MMCMPTIIVFNVYKRRGIILSKDGSVFDDLEKIFIAPNECEACGAKEELTKTYVSNFFGKGEYKYLCVKCALLEKTRKY